MFATAKTVAAVKKTGKKDKKTFALTGLAQYAAIDAVIKALEGVKKVVEADVKGQAAVEFLRSGLALQKRPENFTGTDGDARASVELRSRSVSSPVSEETAKRLNEAGIPTEKVTNGIETFIINPAYKDDLTLLAKIEAALSGVEGIPADLFQKQEPDTKIVVSKEGLDKLFTLDETVAQDLLPEVGVLALKPVVPEDQDITQAVDLVAKLLGCEDEAEIEAEAA